MRLTVAFTPKDKTMDYASSQSVLGWGPSTTSYRLKSTCACQRKQFGVSCSTLYDKDLGFHHLPYHSLAFSWFLGPQGWTPIGHNSLCDT